MTQAPVIDKFGPETSHFGLGAGDRRPQRSMTMAMRGILLALTVTAGSAATASAQTLFAGGAWAAVRLGQTCEAAARPLPPAAAREPEARAGFRFDAGGRRRGEFHVRLSRIARPGSSVMLKVGGQPFLLVAQGGWAWSRGPAQDMAVIGAVRVATAMRVEGRDAAGRRFADIYLLGGAPTAIDAAAAACASDR